MNGERFEQITVTVEGGVATVTLNRPDRYNALCSRIVDELGDVLEEVEGSVEVKVLIRQSSRDYATRRQPSARPSSEDYQIGLSAFADREEPRFPPLTARRII